MFRLPHFLFGSYYPQHPQGMSPQEYRRQSIVGQFEATYGKGNGALKLRRFLNQWTELEFATKHVSEDGCRVYFKPNI